MTCRRQRNRLLRSELSTRCEMRSLLPVFFLVVLVFFVHTSEGVANDKFDTK